MADLRPLAAQALGYCIVGSLMLTAGRAYLPVRVTGGSMRPTLVHGDVVLVRKGAAPRAGRVGLFRSGSSQVLHRVRSVAKDGSMVTRGDANPIDDLSAVPPENVVGEVVRVIPVGALVERWR